MSNNNANWVVKDSNGNIIAGPTTLAEAQRQVQVLTESGGLVESYTIAQLLLG